MTRLQVAVYGKLPSHGDFLRRRISDAFVATWDEWLQQCIALSRRDLVDSWLDIYLTSPAWRFASCAGVLGSHPTAGVMLPSVDRVGRCFPLVVAVELEADDPGLAPSPLALAIHGDPWFAHVEQLGIEALATEALDFEAFDAQLLQSACILEPLLGPAPVVLEERDASRLMQEPDGMWQFPLDTASSLGTVVEQLAYARLHSAVEHLMLWWTEGSAVVSPCCVLGGGLPQPAEFASLLDGTWGRRVARRSLRTRHLEQPAYDATMTRDAPVLEYSSAGLTDRGSVRSCNQDAFIERCDAGIWAVADGMGGHEKGELASRMVCDSLMALNAEATLEATLTAVEQRLKEVNAYLHHASTRTIAPINSGSTVVVLVARADACAVLWAGDSRAYRVRGGELERLTQDHVWSQQGSLLPAASEESAITRAVGGEAMLTLDVYRGSVRAGDQFLLCSDGLTSVLNDAAIARLFAAREPKDAVTAMIGAALAAGSSDNVTALVVRAA